MIMPMVLAGAMASGAGNAANARAQVVISALAALLSACKLAGTAGDPAGVWLGSRGGSGLQARQARAARV